MVSARTLLVAALAAVVALAQSFAPAPPPQRPCTLDAECTQAHQGVCAAASAAGAQGVCVCGAGMSWHALLRACVRYEAGTPLTLPNATLGYGTQGTGALRFAPDLRWPAAWTCDTAQCRATENGALYVTWRGDVIAAAANETTNASYTLAPEDVWVRCADPPAAAYVRASAAGASVPEQAGVAAWQHCATCAQWCGPQGHCDAVASALRASRQDPALAAFVCACNPGWTGDRCDLTVAAAQQAGVTSAADVGAVNLTLMATHAFPAYDVARACTVDADCAGGASERCYIDVAASRAARRLTRICFCAPGRVPTHGAAASCSASVTQTVSLYGLVGAATRPVSTGPTQTAAEAAAGVTLTAEAWSAASTTLTGYLASTQTAAGDTALQPMFTPATGNQTAAMDATARANPALLACATGGGGGFFAAGAVSALAWCGTCAQVCGAGADCTDAAAGSAAADTGTCACVTTHTGTACAACAAGPEWIAPVCAETWTKCSALRCSNQGHCFYASSSVANTTTEPRCACDDGWAGHACDTPAGACRAQNCSSHGVCTAEDGVCECDADWVGTDCSVRARECGLALCALDGAAHGNCTADMRCVCDAGWTGPDCAQRWCGTHGGLSAVVAYDVLGAPLLGCDCTAGGVLGGWGGPTCEVDLCGATIGHGAWDAAAGACVCYGVYAPNTSAVPVCSLDRCGDGVPVTANACWCRTPGILEFNAADLHRDETFLCQPRAPALVAAVAHRGGAGAVTDYSARPATFVVPPVTVLVAVAFAYAWAATRPPPGASVK